MYVIVCTASGLGICMPASPGTASVLFYRACVLQCWQGKWLAPSEAIGDALQDAQRMAQQCGGGICEQFRQHAGDRTVKRTV